MATMVLLSLSLAASLSSAASQLTFATSYGSHMVLQQSPQRAVIWGHCTGSNCGTDVTVTLQSGSSTATTFKASNGGVDSTWIAKLPATSGGDTPYDIKISSGAQSVSISDVLFGDVWVCSGQSNMAFLLENAFNGSELVKDADNHPTIRLFTSKKTSSAVPLSEQPEVQEQWSVSSHTSVTDDNCPHCNDTTTTTKPHTVDDQHLGLGDDNWLYMSAVCYIFGKNIQAHTGKPVGLVNTNWGGTPVEFWMSEEAEAACPDGPKGWKTAWNGMVTPLLNMTIYGSIWYQGESNQGDKLTATDPQGLPMVSYGCRFPAMIADWRKKWAEGSMGETSDNFPFGFVNLAPWGNPDNSPAAVRWGQSAGYGHVPNPAMPNVFDAVALDLTDHTSPYGSVHIRDKTSVGDRLALGGIAMAYGDKSTYWQGPIVESSTVKQNTVEVMFTNTGAAGLQVSGVGWETCIMNVPSQNCTMKANNGTAPGQWATAKVVSSTSSSVTVSMGSAANAGGTVLVRYGWAAVPFEYKQAGIYAKTEQLPAGPFVVKVGTAVVD